MIDFKYIHYTAFVMSLLGILAFIADLGFSQSEQTQWLLNVFYFIVLAMGMLATVLRYLTTHRKFKLSVVLFDIGSILFTLTAVYLHVSKAWQEHLHSIFYDDIWINLAVFFSFIREFSELKMNYKRTILNPAQLFVISFLTVILLGALLLMLPNATYQGISFTNALFTATSAVCVTGLIVVDTGSYFTLFGQTIIVALIQIGGLGILTFASYFSYFFKGVSSYENHLVLSDMTNSKKLGEVFSLLKYILLITFGIEFIAAILIYTTIDSQHFNSSFEQLYFSAFHAISAFCNAGFSTLPNSLYEGGFRFNYSLQLVLICTFVLGGLGFPIVVNIKNYLKYRIATIFKKKKQQFKPWVLNLNSRITLITTASLSIIGFVLFYILEYSNTLAEHDGFGKLVVALFGATTPRTAGFNSIDTAAMSFPALMMVILLMWIGASPSSTGGGIKTSTFAIATLNIFSLAKGKDRIEVFRREIADSSVRRAFAIISLSLIVIGTGVLIISISDPEKSLISIAFECFSAYSTVGLSLGITGSLSMTGKLVIIAIMFIGRVSMLSIIIAFFKKEKHKNYNYPTEEITIN